MEQYTKTKPAPLVSIMNAIRKFAGVIWILLALAAGYYLIVNQAIPKFESPKPEDRIPAIIYACILTPIIVGGLLVFGWYSLTGEYKIYEDTEHHLHIKED